MWTTDSEPESATRVLNRSVLQPFSAAGFAWIGLFTSVADSGPESAFCAIKRNPAVAVHPVAEFARIRTTSDAVQAASSPNPQRQQGSS